VVRPAWAYRRSNSCGEEYWEAYCENARSMSALEGGGY
jgi:hypothetical protein